MSADARAAEGGELRDHGTYSRRSCSYVELSRVYVKDNCY